MYVPTQSNHPDAMLKSIPVVVNKRLNVLSSNEEAFISVEKFTKEPKMNQDLISI